MSYFYVYDKFVQDKKHEKDLVRIEHRLTDIGIQGKIGRLALFRHAGELVRDEVRRGAETVVVVGNDDTFHAIMSVLPELKVTVGFIPIGEPCHISTVLGVPYGAAACDVLSARITETLDVGKVNNQYFLTSVEVLNQAATIDCEGKYQVKAASGGAIEVRNLGSLGYKDLHDGLANPRDGMLEVVVYAELPKEHFYSRPKITQSVLPMRHLKILGTEPFQALVDGVRVQFETIELSVIPKSLKIITGKGRMI